MYNVKLSWDTAEDLVRVILKEEVERFQKLEEPEFLKALIAVYNYFSPRNEQLEEPK